MKKHAKFYFRMKKMQNFFCTKQQRKIFFGSCLSIRQLSALGCWKVTLLLLLWQKYVTITEHVVITLYQPHVKMVVHETKGKNYNVFIVWNLWKSCACTFRCLVLLQWERMSGKGAIQDFVGSNLYCSLLNSKSPLMCIIGKQRKDHTQRSLNYSFFANQWVLFFAMTFLALKDLALTGHLKTANCGCLWSSANVFEAAKQAAPAVTCCWKQYLC